MESVKISEVLDPIIRMRAVQDFSASKATAFVFFLKQIVREAMASEFRDPVLASQMLAFEARIDRLALMAFDHYTACREKLSEIRTDEMRRRIGAMQRAGLVQDEPG